MEDGGTHSSPTALGLGISASHPPQISQFFVWDWEGAQKCFILRNQTTGDLTFTSPGQTHSPVCAPHGLLFFQQSCYVGNLLSYISNIFQLCITVYSCNIISCMNFLGHSQPLRGGTCPPGPPLGPALQGSNKTILLRMLICDHRCSYFLRLLQ